MEAVKQTKVDMMVTLGIYVSPEGDYTAYDRQKAAITDVLKTYGTDHIAGITGESACDVSIRGLGLTILACSWQ